MNRMNDNIHGCNDLNDGAGLLLMQESGMGSLTGDEGITPQNLDNEIGNASADSPSESNPCPHI